MSIAASRMASPVGPLRLQSDGEALTRLEFVDPDEMNPPAVDGEPCPVLVEACGQLQAYFEGRLRAFDLPIRLQGSAFQLQVWEQLRRIRYGTTMSYGEIATTIGMPVTASRAVGLANGANPIAIVVPCHRVIGANGKLIGYGGGLDRKRFLLALEAPVVQDGLFAG
jgi:methylated-DNA-[protein]-cysteine S-methyltransferase